MEIVKFLHRVGGDRIVEDRIFKREKPPKDDIEEFQEDIGIVMAIMRASRDSHLIQAQQWKHAEDRVQEAFHNGNAVAFKRAIELFHDAREIKHEIIAPVDSDLQSTRTM